MKYHYMYSCTQGDGSTWTMKMKGFNYRQALERMKEDKAIFKGCKDWKIIKMPYPLMP